MSRTRRPSRLRVTKSIPRRPIMRIFIAGASGAVGQPLVRRLAEAGHEVHGMTRTPAKAERLRELGAVPVVADALDRDAVMAAVREARPDVVVHHLAAIRHLEAAVTGAQDLEGIVLRYGGFYGPGTSIARGGDMLENIVKGRFPVVGDGAGVWSLVHIEDAAEATVRAIERGAPGIYNICDDEPAPVREWLPVLAEAVGGRRPRHMPGFLGRLLLGPAGYAMMTSIRGASNAKAKHELGWTPAYPSWRQGFAAL